MGVADNDQSAAAAAPIWSTIRGFCSYWILAAAVDLGVFAALAEGGRTAAALATRCSASERQLSVMLNLLVELKFLDRRKDEYCLTSLSSTFLVPGSRAYLGALVTHSPGRHENWPALAATVRGGQPPAAIENEPEAFYVELALSTFPLQFEAARGLIANLGLARLRNVEQIIELGAGAAPWSAALLETFPRASATVNDLPAVLECARQVLENRCLIERCRLVPGDFHRMEVKAEAHDLAILAHVCRGEGEAGARGLITRMFRALRPGGYCCSLTISSMIEECPRCRR